MRYLGLALLLLFGSGVLHAPAQSTPEVPLKGVVWQQPERLDEAVADLLAMRDAGVEAVRTGLVDDDRLLTLADSLQIQFFQELPIHEAPAATLLDTAAYAIRILERALSQARNHPSARHFGLTSGSDTAHPEACAYLEALARRVRENGPAGSRAYYATPFVETEQCLTTVDLVLLDGPDPMRALARWQEIHPDVPVGLGALGVWVDDAARGLAAPLSPERQARYLEIHLTALLKERSPVRAVFVHRWRDVDEVPFPRPVPMYLRGPLRRGLQPAEGAPRPALDVVRGMYTGEQTVFAFEAGTDPRRAVAWPTMLGWAVLLALAVSYAVSMRFRRMLPRYFMAHGFYQEGLRGGREIPLVSSTVLFASLSIGVGIAGEVVVHALAMDPAFAQLMRWLPAWVHEFVLVLLTRPLVAILLIASIHALLLASWMSVLALLARTQQQQLYASQLLTLVIWPRWPLLGLMVAALSLRGIAPESLADGALALVLAYLVLTAWAAQRTLLDYRSLVPAAPGVLVAATLLHPIVLIALFSALALWQRSPYARFLWHLAQAG